MQSFVYIISVALINCPREGQPLAHHAVSDVDVDGDLATASPPVGADQLFRSAELAPLRSRSGPGETGLWRRAIGPGKVSDECVGV
ncbi:MAG: hypothetical protein WC080_02135 [Patescibacteria group bacterium]